MFRYDVDGSGEGGVRGEQDESETSDKSSAKSND